VMQFDQETGMLLNEQVSFDAKTSQKPASSAIELPWKSWLNEHRDTMSTAADKAAIVAMMDNFHRGWDAAAVDVQIMSAAGKVYVLAGANMTANSLLLPACVPHGCKVNEVKNEHPLAVRVSVSLSDGKMDNVTADNVTADNAKHIGNITRCADYVLLPEFKAPTAVAAKPGESGDEQRFTYSVDDSESMHPFWAVRRITSAKLAEEKKAVVEDMRKTGKVRNVPEFNCTIVNKVHPTISIASIGTQSMTSTRFVTMPFITNVKDVVQGEELICEQVIRAKPEVKKKRNWQQVVKEEKAEAKKKVKVANEK